MKKKFYVLINFLLIIILFFLYGKFNFNAFTWNEYKFKKINVSGSTSMEDILNILGNTFESENCNINIEVQGGGSGVGIINIKNGISNIGNVSRELKSFELNNDFSQYIIAVDGIVLISNLSNKIYTLTQEQLIKIFTGKITNWKNINGINSEIVVIGREAGSGTRDSFESLLNINNKCKYTIELNETGIIKNKVRCEINAIGYISISKIDSTVNIIAINNILPNYKNIINKKYFLIRKFICLINKKNINIQTIAFINFIMSIHGQKIIEKNGLIYINNR